MSGLEADPATAAVLGVERQRVGGLVDGSVVDLVDGGLVRVGVHVVGAVWRKWHILRLSGPSIKNSLVQGVSVT